MCLQIRSRLQQTQEVVTNPVTSFRWVAVSACFLLSGFVFSDNQKIHLQKALAGSKSFSTGLAQVSLDTTDLGKLVEHSLKDAVYPNGLYQSFFGIHYESMGADSLLHSSVGRTHSQGFAGDRTDWTNLSPSKPLRSGAEADTYAVDYSNPQILPFLTVEQILIIPSDSGRSIGLQFVVHVTADSGDTLKNAKMIFGYDADLGSQTGGYGDDLSEAINDSVQLLYAFDAAGDLVTGVSYRSGGQAHLGGNILGLHQTVNRIGGPPNLPDSVLLGMINNPIFNPTAPPGDVSLYWVVSLGTYSDTVSDTIRFSLVNGHTKTDIRNAELARHSGAAVSRQPMSFMLFKNYPNPFNPSTTIAYRLEKETNFELSIYNMVGQRIRILEKGRHDAGIYNIVWDGRDDAGKTVSSGVYIYRLSDRVHSTSRKLLLLK